MNTRIHQLSILFIFLIIAVSHAIPAIGQHVQEKIKKGLFIENKGQWERQILYRSDLPSGQLYIEKDRFLFNFLEKEPSSHHHGTHSEEPIVDIKARTSSSGDHHEAPILKGNKGHAYEVRFLGCNTLSGTTGESASTYQSNYFQGNDPTKWATNVQSYQQIALENIYPGTMLKCLGKETGFKYEFHLKPGAEASKIRLQYTGADTLYLKNGELIIKTSVNTLTEQRPYSYQIIDGQNREVECTFVLKDRVLTFAFPKGYDKKYPLVIDPQLIFSTYSGSYSDNWGNTATYDEEGNAYMAGIVFGPDYTDKLGGYMTTDFFIREGIQYSDLTYTLKYDPDVAIMKFSTTGALIYATYLGGTETEIPTSIIVNKQKQLVILGFTGSDGRQVATGIPGIAFPTTTGAYDRTFNGGIGTTNSGGPLGRYDGIFFDRGSDLFVSILSEGGNALIASTLIGGSGNDGVTYRQLDPVIHPLVRNYGDQFRSEILCDEQDDIYIVSKTTSTNIINNAVPGYNKTHSGLTDAYVCKMNATLGSMIWNTYIGGTGEDAGYSIRIKSDKSVYVCGGTTSLDFPMMSPLKGTLNANDTDGFISHISADGSSLLHSTYIGTDAYDQTFFIQLDNTENVFVLGQTLGNYPMTAGVYGNPSTGQFIQKLNPELNTSLMSTTFGNVANKVSIVPTAFLVNDCGNIMLSGWGGEINSPTEYEYVRSPFGDYVQEAVTNYLGGNTLDMPLTSDALYKITDGSDFYVMVLKKDAEELLYATYFGGLNEDDHVDGGTSRFDKRGIIYQSVCASCGGTSHFTVTDGSTNNSGNCNNAIFKFDLTNIKAAFDTDTTKGCGSVLVTVTNKSIGKNSQWDFGDGTSSDQFNPPPHRYTSPGTYTIRLIVTDLTTCIGKDTAEKTITVYALPAISIGVKDTVICKKDSIQLLTSCNPYWTYQWSPLKYINNPDQCAATFYPPVRTKYFVTVTDTNFCVKKDSTIIKVAEIIQGIDWQNISECKGKPTIQFKNASVGPLNYQWYFGDGTNSSEVAPTHVFEGDGHYAIHVTMSNTACSGSDDIALDLKEVMIPNLITKNNDGKNDCFEILGLYEGWRVEIYNVWSKRVFLNENYANDFCGDNLSPTVYYYLVCPPHGDCCKSWVQVMY